MQTFFLFGAHVDLAALGNLDSLNRLAATADSSVLDLLDNVVAVDDLAEDNVLAVEPRGDDCGDEEL